MLITLCAKAFLIYKNDGKYGSQMRLLARIVLSELEQQLETGRTIYNRKRGTKFSKSIRYI